VAAREYTDETIVICAEFKIYRIIKLSNEPNDACRDVDNLFYDAKSGVDGCSYAHVQIHYQFHFVIFLSVF
jgi:hypothetical protein